MKWSRGKYTVTESYTDGIWTVQHLRNGRLLESVNTSCDDKAGWLFVQFKDESITALSWERWAV